VVEQSNKELWKSVAILSSYLGAYWFSSFVTDWFIAQMFIYIGLYSLVTWLLLRSEVRELVIVASRLRRKHPV